MVLFCISANHEIHRQIKLSVILFLLHIYPMESISLEPHCIVINLDLGNIFQSVKGTH